MQLGKNLQGDEGRESHVCEIAHLYLWGAGSRLKEWSMSLQRIGLSMDYMKFSWLHRRSMYRGNKSLNPTCWQLQSERGGGRERARAVAFMSCLWDSSEESSWTLKNRMLDKGFSYDHWCSVKPIIALDFRFYDGSQSNYRQDSCETKLEKKILFPLGSGGL